MVFTAIFGTIYIVVYSAIWIFVVGGFLLVFGVPLTFGIGITFLVGIIAVIVVLVGGGSSTNTA